MPGKIIYNYAMKKVSEVPEDMGFKRVGIIPYFIFKGIHHYFLMRDSKFDEWTDCGGSPEANETWLDTAIRETKEESRQFFRFDKNFVLNNGYICWREDLRIAIIFCQFKIHDLRHASSICHKYRRDFLKGIERRDHRKTLENSDLDFYTQERIKKEGQTIYKLVRCLLRAFFRLGGIPPYKPYQYRCSYDKKSRGDYDNTVSTHKGVSDPQARDDNLKCESICGNTPCFFCSIDSKTLCG